MDPQMAQYFSQFIPPSLADTHGPQLHDAIQSRAIGPGGMGLPISNFGAFYKVQAQMQAGRQQQQGGGSIPPSETPRKMTPDTPNRGYTTFDPRDPHTDAGGMEF